MMNEVKEEVYISDFGYDGTEPGHMWANPRNNQDPALYLDANFEKAFKIDDISSVFHYELIADHGGLNLCMTGEGKGELRCGDFDGMVHQDEIPNLHSSLSVSNASEDYILDVDFAKKVPELDYQFCEELSMGNLSSEVCSPGTSNELCRVSESSNQVLEWVGKFEETTACGMHDVSGSKRGCETLLEDKMGLKCLLTCDLQGIHETNNDQSPLKIRSSLDHGIKNASLSPSSVTASKTAACVQYDEGRTEAEVFSIEDMPTDNSGEVNIGRVRTRRLCKPPQRYIEGSPWLQSRFCTDRKCSTSSSNDGDLGVKCRKKHQGKSSRRKASKAAKNNLDFDSDEEYSLVIRKSRKKSDRRKNNKLWTLAEVEKVVDGISQFGLGQWTAIKGAFFSSSRRTPTDIRDKWRNLVKTNCRIVKRKKEDDQCLRSGSEPLPEPVIERVRELAITNSIPRRGSKRGAKLSNSIHHDVLPSN